MAKNLRHISIVAKSEMNNIAKRKSGEVKSLITPWKCFNNALLNGIPWGYIMTVAGMSGSGKTLFVNQLETELFNLNPDEKFHILALNYEMTAERLVGRKLSTYLQKSTKQLYSADIENPSKNINDNDIEKAHKYIEKLSELPIWYQDLAETLIGIKRTIVDHFKDEVKDDEGVLVTIDHSLLIRGQTSETANQTLYALGEMLSHLKKCYKVSFIIISQLNRNIESEERRTMAPNKTLLHFPIKSDITQADALFQHSDMVLVIHMPSKLNLPYYGPEKWATTNVDIYFHFLKARDGDEFISKMIAQYNTMQIKEC